jgi:hypothetical protein
MLICTIWILEMVIVLQANVPMTDADRFRAEQENLAQVIVTGPSTTGLCPPTERGIFDVDCTRNLAPNPTCPSSIQAQFLGRAERGSEKSFARPRDAV